MKKMLLAACLLMTAAAMSAQIPQGELRRTGTHLKLDKQKLNEEETALILSDVAGEDCRDEWAGYAKNYKTGIGLLTGGGIAAGSGVVMAGLTAVTEAICIVIVAPFWALDSDESSRAQSQHELEAKFQPWYVASGVLFAAGVATGIAGIPVMAVNGKRMNGIVNRYNGVNPSAPAELTLGLQPHGIGVSLRF